MDFAQLPRGKRHHEEAEAFRRRSLACGPHAHPLGADRGLADDHLRVSPSFRRQRPHRQRPRRGILARHPGVLGPVLARPAARREDRRLPLEAPTVPRADLDGLRRRGARDRVLERHRVGRSRLARASQRSVRDRGVLRRDPPRGIAVRAGGDAAAATHAAVSPLEPSDPLRADARLDPRDSAHRPLALRHGRAWLGGNWISIPWLFLEDVRIPLAWIAPSAFTVAALLAGSPYLRRAAPRRSSRSRGRRPRVRNIRANVRAHAVLLPGAHPQDDHGRHARRRTADVGERFVLRAARVDRRRFRHDAVRGPCSRAWPRTSSPASAGSLRRGRVPAGRLDGRPSIARDAGCARSRSRTGSTLR